jgi:hypothetical protein
MLIAGNSPPPTNPDAPRLIPKKSSNLRKYNFFEVVTNKVVDLTGNGDNGAVLYKAGQHFSMFSCVLMFKELMKKNNP